MMKKVIGTMLLASVICAGTFLAAQPDEFTFRNGVTWGMSKDEVIGTEDASPSYDGDVDLPDGRILTVLVFEDVTVDGFGASAEYMFTDDTLVCCGYEFEEGADSAILLNSLETKYGESGPVNWEYADSMILSLGGHAEDVKEAEFSCEWNVSDDLYVMMYDVEKGIATAYFNPSAILDKE